MNENPLTCDDTALEHLLGGDQSAEPSDSILSHVESCTRCQQRISDLAGPTAMWHDVKAAISAADASDQPRLLPSITFDPASIHWTESMAKQLLSPPTHPEMLGRLGRYEVERLIGSGGMGVVFKAFDTELNRPVAIKLLAPYLSGSGPARKRFAREARAAAAVVHQHVVPIHNVETERESPFIVMQYVSGESLQARIDRQGPLELCEILRIGMQVADGLSAAHQQGLVHRDIKPSNILLEEGVDRALISDFGLARAADDASLTRTGFHPGTPQYMSPEQASGQSVDARSDLFSLGSMLYTMCTGSPPFRADNSLSVMRRITDSEPRPIRESNPAIPTWLCDMISTLMAKKDSNRYQSAAEVHGLLEGCLKHIQNPDGSLFPKISRHHIGRKRFVTLLASGALTMTIIAFIFGMAMMINQPNSGINDLSALRESLSQANEIFIYEGLPHPAHETDLLEQEIKRSAPNKISDHWFYVPKVKAPDEVASELKKILLDDNSYLKPDGPPRDCGFHPDYAVAWNHDGKECLILICYGCREAVFVYGDQSWKRSINSSTDALKKTLQPFHSKRPNSASSTVKKPTSVHDLKFANEVLRNLQAKHGDLNVKLRMLLSEHSGIPRNQWLAYRADPTKDGSEVVGSPLSWVLLHLDTMKAIEDNPGCKEEFEVFNLEERSTVLNTAMAPSIDGNTYSLIQPGNSSFMYDLSRDSSGQWKLKGTCKFSDPGLYAGNVGYAIGIGNNMELTLESFSLPQHQILLLRDDQGVWQRQADPDQAAQNPEDNSSLSDDTASHVLGHGYARQGNFIFFDKQRIDQAGREDFKQFAEVANLQFSQCENVDAPSFKALSEEYTKDKNNVYYKCTSPGRYWVITLATADVSSFEVIGFNLAKDVRHVWWDGKPLEGVDPQTVKLVRNGFVWKDAKSVWYQETMIPGADVETFRHLGQAFYRDANRVYWSTTPLDGADPDTFRTFGDDCPFGADRKRVWHGDTTIEVYDSATFQPIHQSVYKDKSGVYASHHKIQDADPKSFYKVANLDTFYSALLADDLHFYVFLPLYGDVYRITSTAKSLNVERSIWPAGIKQMDPIATATAELSQAGWKYLNIAADPGVDSNQLRDREMYLLDTYKAQFSKAWDIIRDGKTQDSFVGQMARDEQVSQQNQSAKAKPSSDGWRSDIAAFDTYLGELAGKARVPDKASLAKRVTIIPGGEETYSDVIPVTDGAGGYIDLAPAEDTAQFQVNNALKGQAIKWEFELASDASRSFNGVVWLTPKSVREEKARPFLTALIIDTTVELAFKSGDRLTLEGTIGDASQNQGLEGLLTPTGPVAVYHLDATPDPVFWLGLKNVKIEGPTRQSTTRLKPAPEVTAFAIELLRACMLYDEEKLNQLYASEVQLLPGNRLFYFGLEVPGKMTEYGVPINRDDMLVALKKHSAVAPIPSVFIDQFLSIYRIEQLDVAVGEYATEPNQPSESLFRSMRFKVERNDVLLKVSIGGVFRFVQLRKADERWKVVAEY